MEFNELYNFLTTKEFKDTDTGNLFFPAYMFTYPAEKEYEIRNKILELKNNLKRPNNYLDSLDINIFNEFIEFLKSHSFMGENLLQLVFDKEEDEGAEEIINYLKTKSNSEEFYSFLAKKVNTHFAQSENFDTISKVYVLMYGFGSIFPFLRTSVFLNNFQKYITKYKLILFYPGEYRNGSYYLFDRLDDKHLYRASRLNDF